MISWAEAAAGAWHRKSECGRYSVCKSPLIIKPPCGRPWSIDETRFAYLAWFLPSVRDAWICISDTARSSFNDAAKDCTVHITSQPQRPAAAQMEPKELDNAEP